MTYKAPGKHFREGLTTRQFFAIFPTDDAAEAWFCKEFWPEEMCCPRCGSTNVQTGAKHKTMPFRCRACRKRFSTKTGTFMEASNLGYQSWLYAFYLFCTLGIVHEAPPGTRHFSEICLVHGTPAAWNTQPVE